VRRRAEANEQTDCGGDSDSELRLRFHDCSIMPALDSLVKTNGHYGELSGRATLSCTGSAGVC
jgi:hypothetical protein